jgi:integrase
MRSYLLRREYDALIAACEVPHLRLFVTLALATAGRASAVLELTWDRIDFERGQIQLKKHEVVTTLKRRRKGRPTVPMTDRARAALIEAYNARESIHVIQ